MSAIEVKDINGFITQLGKEATAVLVALANLRKELERAGIERACYMRGLGAALAEVAATSVQAHEEGDDVGMKATRDRLMGEFQTGFDAVRGYVYGDEQEAVENSAQASS